MRVHVARLGHPVWDLPAVAFETFLAPAAELVDAEQVDTADVILFTQAHMLGRQRLRPILAHPFLATHRERCFSYDERDRPWIALPGLFVSMPADSFDDRFQRAVTYYATEAEAELIAGREREADLLFSFVGARSHRCRAEMLELSHPRAIVTDTSGFTFYASADADRQERRRNYLDTLARTKFVLSPRGAGTASIRMLEVLAAGRVPVIVGDAWVPPPMIDWSACSIRVAERDVPSIPRLLAEREAEWPRLAGAATAAYDRLLRLEDGARARTFVAALQELVDRGAANFTPSPSHRRRELTVRVHDTALSIRPFLGRQRRRLTAAARSRRS